MANISELFKHPALLAIIPATLGLIGTLYVANKEPDKKAAPEQVVVKPAEAAKVDSTALEAAAQARAKEKELDIEKTFWASIQPPNDSEANYCAYLDRYPQGHFEVLAQEHCSLDTLADWQANKKKEQTELTAKAEKEKAELAEKEQAEQKVQSAPTQ